MLARHARLVVAATACFAASPVWADVTLGSTRVIFPSTEREVTVRVTNEGKSPRLVQAWLDTGDAQMSPDEIDVPFVLTPSMFRLDAKKGQSLRVLYSGTPLATDKETLFWLNVLEVPPKPKAGSDEPNHLQLAFRTRIKLMFRPAGLAGTAEDAPAQVSWSLARHADGSYRLEARNPTPYHINLSKVSLQSGEETYLAGSGFVAPGATQQFAVRDLNEAPRHDATVEYRFISDYGGSKTGSASLRATVTP